MGVAFFPEGSEVRSTDSEQRALAKICQKLYDTYAPGASVPFPEGNRPLASDDEARLTAKINALTP